MDYSLSNTSLIKDCPKVESNIVFGIGITIMVLGFLSYMPQYYKIVQRRSVIGISAVSLFLGCVSAFCNFFGTFLLDAHFWQCCHQNHLSHTQCFITLLPMVQLFFIWIFLNVFYILFLIYFNKSHGVDVEEIRSAKLINTSFFLYVLIFPICFGFTGTFLLVATNIISRHIILYGNLLNGIASGLTLFMWAPQIWITYKKQDFVSLSPLTIGIQAIGSIVIFVYQVLLSKSDLSIGVPFLVAGLEQITVLVIGYYYRFKNWKSQKKMRDSLNERNYLLKDVFQG